MAASLTQTQEIMQETPVTPANNLRPLEITNLRMHQPVLVKDITITMERALMGKKTEEVDRETDSLLEIMAVESFQIQITIIITRVVEVVIVVVDVIDSEINKAKGDQEATTIALAAPTTSANPALAPTTVATTTTATKILHPKETLSGAVLAIRTETAINNQIILKLRPSQEELTHQLVVEVTEHKTIKIREELLVHTPTLRDSKSSIKIKATILKATATNHRSQAAVDCL